MLPLSVVLAVSLVLSLVTILTVLAVGWGLRHGRQAAQCDAQRMFEQLDLIRAELMILADRVQSMEIPAPVQHERPAPPEVRAPAVTSAPAPRGYEVAARLARGGATCEELISSCGLSRHEAELLIRLNKAETARNKPVAASAPQVKPDSAPRRASEATRARLAAVV